MATADKAVLSLVKAQVFGPDVRRIVRDIATRLGAHGTKATPGGAALARAAPEVRRIVRDIATRRAATGPKATAERAALDAASRKLDAQQRHFVDAIADGGGC